jgi:hypothetical protein
VTPLSGCGKAAARRLTAQLGHGGHRLADGNDDASPVSGAAWAAGDRLVAPFRKAKDPGCGKHSQSPHRLRGIGLMRSDFGRGRSRARTEIERRFGHAAGSGGGLTPPPAWVRGLPRVCTWTWAKRISNGVRIRRHHDLRRP